MYHGKSSETLLHVQETQTKGIIVNRVRWYFRAQGELSEA